MELLQELKAMPVTLHLLQVGPCMSLARGSSRGSSSAPSTASWSPSCPRSAHTPSLRRQPCP